MHKVRDLMRHGGVSAAVGGAHQARLAEDVLLRERDDAAVIYPADFAPRPAVRGVPPLVLPEFGQRSEFRGARDDHCLSALVDHPLRESRVVAEHPRDDLVQRLPSHRVSLHTRRYAGDQLRHHGREVRRVQRVTHPVYEDRVARQAVPLLRSHDGQIRVPVVR
ncbi:hypothetical protein GCM10023196_017080 [Actinoallomurus vinaceus]|uniref:Uncharacterized protein n=1 Tax=Actinoallomurus vinaceus TaxID=1080074 RepID=A0ABP8U5B4_9ACTN